MGRILGVLEAHGIHLPQEPKRKIVSLDDQFAAMDKEITTLKAENLKLRAENEPLHREIDRHKKQLEVKNGLNLHAEETEILRHLAESQMTKDAEQIGGYVDLNKFRILVRLKELQKRGLVRRGRVRSLPRPSQSLHDDRLWRVELVKAMLQVRQALPVAVA